MNREELLLQFPDKIEFGNSGSYIKLIDVMGNDAAICDAARTSYGEGTKSVSENRDLIRYLIRNWHSSPIEMCELKLFVSIPMDMMRQLQRHRTSTFSSYNEYSTRYSVAIDHTATTPSNQWRLQATNNKQGSAGYLIEWPHATPATYSPGEYLSNQEQELHALAHDIYKERLLFGIAREQARKDLPLSTYTQFYMKCDLWNLLHLMRLRLDSHAQLEIRQLATAMSGIIQAWVPDAWSAFEDYQLHAVTFSAAEQRVLIDLLDMHKTSDLLEHIPQAERADKLIGFGLTSKTERIEFIQKLKRLLGEEHDS